MRSFDKRNNASRGASQLFPSSPVRRPLPHVLRVDCRRRATTPPVVCCNCSNHRRCIDHCPRASSEWIVVVVVAAVRRQLPRTSFGSLSSLLLRIWTMPMMTGTTLEEEVNSSSHRHYQYCNNNKSPLSCHPKQPFTPVTPRSGMDCICTQSRKRCEIPSTPDHEGLVLSRRGAVPTERTCWCLGHSRQMMMMMQQTTDATVIIGDK